MNVGQDDLKILWDSAERQCSLARREQRQHFGARGAMLKLVQERVVWLERLAARATEAGEGCECRRRRNIQGEVVEWVGTSGWASGLEYLL